LGKLKATLVEDPAVHQLTLEVARPFCGKKKHLSFLNLSETYPVQTIVLSMNIVNTQDLCLSLNLKIGLIASARLSVHSRRSGKFSWGKMDLNATLSFNFSPQKTLKVDITFSTSAISDWKYWVSQGH
jgi:hypothetical protein